MFAILWIVVATMPSILEGSPIGAAVTAFACVAIYYGGVSTAIAASLPSHKPPRD